MHSVAQNIDDLDADLPRRIGVSWHRRLPLLIHRSGIKSHNKIKYNNQIHTKNKHNNQMLLEREMAQKAGGTHPN